ncbi:MAG: hypothetical protein KGN79_16300, partial [Acidobacteriota bacterium]|nr:hypothetical protein [Acidobacteriota bacterium]
YSLTRDLDYEYNAPVIVPGGIPVDIDAAARRQHDAAMGAQPPAEPQIVQIAGVANPAATQRLPEAPHGEPASNSSAHEADPSAS